VDGPGLQLRWVLAQIVYEGGLLLLFVFAHSENVFSALRFLLSLVHFDMFFIYTALHMVNHQNLWNVLVYKPYH